MEKSCSYSLISKTTKNLKIDSFRRERQLDDCILRIMKHGIQADQKLIMTEVREMGGGEGGEERRRRRGAGRDRERERLTTLRWLLDPRVGTRKDLLLVAGYTN